MRHDKKLIFLIIIIIVIAVGALVIGFTRAGMDGRSRNEALGALFFAFCVCWLGLLGIWRKRK